MTGIYGPNQFGGEDHGWVANFAIRAELGLPITIFGTGKQLRDILFASEAAAAFEAFYKSPKPGIYNVGSGETNAISLIESIQLIEELLGKKADVRFEEGRFGDLRYFVTDYSKVRSAIDWEPKVSPREGIGDLVHWIRSNPPLFSSPAVVA